MKFIDNGRKNPKLWERNWFFATTAFFILLNVILYAALGSWRTDIDNELSFDQIQQGFTGNKYHWEDVLYFKGLLQTFLNAYSHANWQHVLLNMLCFAVCGVYLERKTGSLYFFLLTIGLTFFGDCATAANNNSVFFHGFSGANYALYAYILVDYLFCVIPKSKRNKTDIIYGGVMLGLIYFAMCFHGGTQSVGFKIYPYDLLHNLGHYTSYLLGLILAATLRAIILFTERKAKRENN